MNFLWFKRLLVVLLGGIALLHLSCEQYDYSSPAPGILEFRLHAANNRTLLRFDPGNNFVLTLRNLEVVESLPVKIPVYEDLVAIRRNQDGDFFNCLNPLARDSSFILGRAYSPPTTYTGVNLTVEVAKLIVIMDVYTGFPNIIEVRQDLLTQSVQQLPAFGQPALNISVESNHRTVVTVTFDLDSSLVRRTEWFQYRPYFYVSSVNVY
jgi:hypothetical protein